MIPDFFPRDQYYCVLDEQPDFLVPPEVVRDEGPRDRPLLVNPRAAFGWQGPLPAGVAAAAGDTTRMFVNPWMIWVDDPDRHAVWPYWLGPEWAPLLERLTPGRTFDGGLPDDVVGVLRTADVLVTDEGLERRHRHWRDAAAAAGSQFEQGAVVLNQLLPAFHLGALRRYYRYHTRVGSFPFGDEQSPGRYVSYDEPVTRYFHRQLARTVSDVARRVVVPSYNYLALYQGGASLDPHVDREACEYTVSLCVDATPDPHTHGAWPLHLQLPGGTVSVLQEIGDGVLFRGRYLPHWRDRLPEGYTASSVLFHYIDAT